jgi:hypothetical protein
MLQQWWGKAGSYLRTNRNSMGGGGLISGNLRVAKWRTKSVPWALRSITMNSRRLLKLQADNGGIRETLFH